MGGSQMISSSLPVGHADRHEVSFGHYNDICFRTKVTIILYMYPPLYTPHDPYLCYRGFTALVIMLRSYAAIAITITIPSPSSTLSYKVLLCIMMNIICAAI